MVDRKMVTIVAACKLAHVRRKKLHDWMNTGKVEWTKIAGGAIRIYLDTLEKMIRWQELMAMKKKLRGKYKDVEVKY